MVCCTVKNNNIQQQYLQAQLVFRENATCLIYPAGSSTICPTEEMANCSKRRSVNEVSSFVDRSNVGNRCWSARGAGKDSEKGKQSEEH